MTEVKDILEGWEKQGVAFVRFELPDMHGISRSKTIPVGHAADYAERGLNMYGGASVLDTRSDVVGGTLYHEEVGYGDQLLFPDPDSAAVLPWADRTARLICDPRWHDGTPLEATPRSVFRRALEKCAVDGVRAAHRAPSSSSTSSPATPMSRCSPATTSSTRCGTTTSRRSAGSSRRCRRSGWTSSPRTASTRARSGRSTSRPAKGSPVRTTPSRSRTASRRSRSRTATSRRS